jgi:NitT/TauT family transport system substrate-binding protein
MVRRRSVLSGLASTAILAAGPWVAGCSADHPLAVGIHPWIGYETLYLAREFGWLPPWVSLDEGGSAGHTLAKLHSGWCQAGCLTLDEMLQARGAGVPLTAVAVFDVSAGADQVVARPGIDGLAGLANRRLGVEKGAVGALVLTELLKAAGLDRSRVVVVDLPLDRQVAAWRGGEVDAVVTFEPTATVLRREGGTVLFDSRQMPDAIFDVLAVRSDRVAQRHAMRALVGSHFRALEHIRTNADDAIFRIAAHQEMSPEEVRHQLGGVMLPTLFANRGYLEPSGSQLVEAAVRLSAQLVRDGTLAQSDGLDDLVSPVGLPPREG